MVRHERKDGMKNRGQEEVGEVESDDKTRGGMTNWGKQRGKSGKLPPKGQSSEAVKMPEVWS